VQGRSVAVRLIQPVLVRDDQPRARSVRPSRWASRRGDRRQLCRSRNGSPIYAAVGVTHFVLEAAPSSLEEAYRIGQHVLPRFRALTERDASPPEVKVMSIDFYWRLPTHGCHGSLRDTAVMIGATGRRSARAISPPASTATANGRRLYAISIISARSPRRRRASGFHRRVDPVLSQYRRSVGDLAAACARDRSFRFMIAFQPGFLNPVHAARMSASLQRATGGRTVFNIITGGGGPSQLWWGDSFTHDDRYGRTSEWLDVFKGVWGGGLLL
jgi:hypothetical protein